MLMLLRASLAKCFLQKCYVLQLLETSSQTPYKGFAPEPYWGTSIPKLPILDPRQQTPSTPMGDRTFAVAISR